MNTAKVGVKQGEGGIKIRPEISSEETPTLTACAATSPDGLVLALIASDGASVCLVPLVPNGTKARSFTATVLAPGRPTENVVPEEFTALAWSHDR